MNATKNFFKGPFRYLGKIDGSSTVPPTQGDPMTLAQLPGAVGQKVVIRVVCQLADGRSSTEVFATVIVTAS